MRHKFDLVEVLAISGFLVAATAAAVRGMTTPPAALHPSGQPNPYLHEDSARPYRLRYKTKHSTNEEEWLIRDFFNDRRGGVFLDVGASHYRDRSNTYYLETALGWSGVAIDAQAEYSQHYAIHRPNTRFIAAFISNHEGSTPVYIPTRNRRVASGDRGFVARNDEIAEQRDVPTTTLTTVLDRAGISKVDFVSLDIELHEPQALAGFDIARFRPALVCVEAHLPVRQAILDYFTRHKFVPVGKYWQVDRANLYFMPLNP